MKVLITGGSGQLSQCLQAVLTLNQVLFWAPDRQQLNICDANSVMQSISDYQPTVVINAAAYTAVDKAESDVQTAYAVNSEAVLTLSNICASQGIRLFHISTDYVFNGLLGDVYTEQSDTCPVSVYGKSKLAGEKHFFNSDVDGAIVRTSWLYSEYGNNFMKTIIRLAAERSELGIVSDQIGVPTYAGDLAEFLWHLLQKSQTDTINKTIFNFCNDGVASWYDFAFEICSKVKSSVKVKPILTVDYPTPAIRPRICVMNNQKASKELGFDNRHWKVALAICIEKYLSSSVQKTTC